MVQLMSHIRYMQDYSPGANLKMKNIAVKLIICCSLLFIVLECSNTREAIPPSNRSLRVESKFTNLSVTLADRVYIKKGRRALTIRNLRPQAKYIVEISKPGFKKTVKTVEIEDNATFTLKIDRLKSLNKKNQKK